MADNNEAEKSKVVGDPNEEEFERIFKKFDSNGDGSISLQELRNCLKQLTSKDDEVKLMMTEIDKNKDGFISYQEFKDFAIANAGIMKDVAKIF